MRAIVTEALEEYMRHDQSAQAPIQFPGIEYSRDGTLTDSMKAAGTGHLISVLRKNGYVIEVEEEADAATALHHVLWGGWTKDEIGSGRFAGRLRGCR